MATVMILVSGGLDSAALVAHALALGHDVRGLYVRYGQQAEPEEQAAARSLCFHFGIPLAEATVSASVDLKEMNAEPGDGPRVVPGRNGILCSVGIGAASAFGADQIWIGCIAEDFADYADCRPAWVAAMSKVGEMACGVSVVAPFAQMTKREVVERAKALFVPTNLCWSCYSPESGHPCGRCNSCISLERAA